MIVHHSTPAISLPGVILLVIFLIIYVRVLIYFIEDLYKPERRVSGGDKTVWLIIIVFGSIIGIMAYLLFGRES